MVHPVQLLSTSRRVDLSLQKSSLMVLIYLKAFQFLKLTFIHDSREIESREQLVKSVGWQIVYIISFKKETKFLQKKFHNLWTTILLTPESTVLFQSSQSSNIGKDSCILGLVLKWG